MGRPKSRELILLISLATLAALANVGCGSPHDPSPSCPTPAQRACTGAGACNGTKTCDPLTGAWSGCLCPEPDGGRDSDGGDVSVSLLGTECDEDSDCPTGVTCLRPDGQQLFGGAPPRGTCVGACDVATGCARFGATAVCVSTDDPTAVPDGGRSGPGLCFESCRVGGGATNKCHRRAGIACAPIEGAGDGAGYCRPLCATSGECLTGVCDPARGVCVASAPIDPGFGLTCRAPMDAGATTPSDGGAADGGGGDANDAGPAPSACGGQCVDIGAMSSVCTRRCVFGSTDECAPQKGNSRRGGCLFVTKGGGIGDLGYCGEICGCNGDCSESSFVCDAFDDAALEKAYGGKGVCTPRALVINRALACP